MILRESVRVSAPAKINWSLEVPGRREDGFHEIDSVFQAVSLTDTLDIRRADSGPAACVITCDDPEIPTDERNLIHAAWREARELRPARNLGVRVSLCKRIPSGAGLGGGSSDAAAMLVGLDRLFGLDLDAADLAGAAARIGSDVPFFIRGGAARARGRGERLKAIRVTGPARHLVIVYPGFASPTAEAYRRLNRGPLIPGGDVRAGNEDRAAVRVRRALEEGAPVPDAARVNDFDTVLCAGDRRYQELKERMIRAGVEHPVLSGSGSACFGVAADGSSARKSADALRGEYPCAFAVRTRTSGVRVM